MYMCNHYLVLYNTESFYMISQYHIKVLYHKNLSSFISYYIVSYHDSISYLI